MQTSINKIRLGWIVAAVSAMLVITAAWPVSADLDSEIGRRAVHAEKIIRPVRPAVAKVTIANKTPDSVITNYGYAYTLSDEIVILDPYGYPQSLDQMWVPCRADITYIVEEGHRKALRIQLTKVEKDATLQFMKENPN